MKVLLNAMLGNWLRMCLSRWTHQIKLNYFAPHRS